MEEQPGIRICFVCGIENPIRLHLAFDADKQGRSVLRPYTWPGPEHRGYPGSYAWRSYVNLGV